jgi:hypothetical protein
MIASLADDQLLDLVIENLASEGYEIHKHPPRRMLPAFMKDYVPDAVALGKEPKLAVELATAPGNGERLSEIAGLFTGRPDWRWQVISPRPVRTEPVAPASDAAIERSLAEYRTLAGDGRSQSAFLLGWALVEALARRLGPEAVTRPLSGQALAGWLMHEGHLDQDAGLRLGDLSRLRNRLAHGDLSAEPRTDDVADLGAIIETLAEERAVPPP